MKSQSEADPEEGHSQNRERERNKTEYLNIYKKKTFFENKIIFEMCQFFFFDNLINQSFLIHWHLRFMSISQMLIVQKGSISVFIFLRQSSAWIIEPDNTFTKQHFYGQGRQMRQLDTLTGFTLSDLCPY